MNAGTMRDVLSFRRPTNTTDAIGSQTVVDDETTQYVEIRGKIEPLRGRELEQARKVDAEATFKILTEWVEDVKHGDLIVSVTDGRKFQIVWIENIDEMDRLHKFLVKVRFN
jgi:SPP1 family predicted phage head-tail adaptor